MAIGPESRGSIVPHISLAAVAAVALTVKPIEHQTANNTHYVSETRHIDEFEDRAFVSRTGARLIRVMRHPHHSPTHLTPAQIAEKKVTPQEMRTWSKVNICEENGNWHVRGSQYSGGLGISNANWTALRPKGYPESAADATPAEQIVVAEKIQSDPPDQNGCEPGGW